MKVWIVGLYLGSDRGVQVQHDSVKVFISEEKAKEYKEQNAFLFMYEKEVEE